MERDIYYDKMMYNSTEFTFRYANVLDGVRLVEIEQKGNNLYRYHDLLFKESYLERLDGGSQIEVLSGSEAIEGEYLFVILGVVNNDIYYGLYKKNVSKNDGSFSLLENGYLNNTESTKKVIPLGNSGSFFILFFQDQYTELPIDDYTDILK